MGDYGLGYCTDSLELGCDCAGEIYYFGMDVFMPLRLPSLPFLSTFAEVEVLTVFFCHPNIIGFRLTDGVLSDSKGDPYTVKKAICMHEIDDGLLWKHVEYRTGHNESRRSRKLVLSFLATVVNYEYRASIFSLRRTIFSGD